jgi:hypothetical protein
MSVKPASGSPASATQSTRATDFQSAAAAGSGVSPASKDLFREPLNSALKHEAQAASDEVGAALSANPPRRGVAANRVEQWSRVMPRFVMDYMRHLLVPLTATEITPRSAGASELLYALDEYLLANP